MKDKDTPPRFGNSFGMPNRTYDRAKWLPDSSGYAVQIEWYGKRRVYCGYTITQGGGNGILVASAPSLKELKVKLKYCWKRKVGYEDDDIANPIPGRYARRFFGDPFKK